MLFFQNDGDKFNVTHFCINIFGVVVAIAVGMVVLYVFELPIPPSRYAVARDGSVFKLVHIISYVVWLFTSFIVLYLLNIFINKKR